MKDASVTLNGRTRHPRQPSGFRRPAPRLGLPLVGRGGVKFEEIIRALNAISYDGPAVGRVGRLRHGPRSRRKEAAQFCKNVDFEPSKRAFDSAFQK